jgi:type IV secretion system protein VirB6
LAAAGSPVACLLTVLMTLYIAFIGYRLILGQGACASATRPSR